MRTTHRKTGRSAGKREAASPMIVDDNFLVDFETAFDALKMAEPEKTVRRAVAKKKSKDRGVREMRTTFRAVAREHLKPTLRYLKAIKLGLASRDLCDLVHFVVGPLIGKTRKVGLVDETRSLITFQRELKSVLKTRAFRITTEQRERLAEAFVPVSRAFELEFRGHSTAVVNLLGYYKTLKRNPEVSEKEIRKLFAIGIPSLTMLRKSSVPDLESLSGIPAEKVAKIRYEARNFNILSLV